ncbi:hypothetical protein COY43_00155 [Candidatus Berkelbacteria bacterium CG_4_10_14_0_8_um_filter_35_9_33_8]|nr:MAG: hypothetical protein COX10_00755 [Candidatus Berkelbacteria bacterium CG23_combo_of_CG06-09_8_20_14_all_33_15]PIZ28525.1 MAG: hypothetical protein COY43_00155 [Candidatus Berkelbacteria bacterium CG_4_10_14_0_8_um_filter_35_9_33_8]PJB52018.1 MAG: hypothetical protein CO100_01130 [Candidatus Berkelbacteria bacterium CG_4_9_14_3_um_filter_33_5]
MSSALFSYDSSGSTLNPEKQSAYHENYLKTGDIGYLHLIALSLRNFVVMIAKKFSNNPDDLSDLVDEGYILTINALKKYNKTEGKITTYVGKSIHNGLRRYINNKCKNLVIPEKLLLYVWTAYQLQKISLINDNQCLSDEEIAIALKINVEEYKYAQKLFHLIPNISLEGFVSQLRFVSQDDTPSDFRDIFPDKLYNLENSVVDSLTIKRMLNYATKKQKEAIEIRFGLEDGQFKTLEETAKILGCNRQNVNVLIKSGLRRIKKKVYELNIQNFL